MEIQDSEKLVSKKCQPCEGGVEPCSLSDANQQLQLLDGWYLTHEGQRIRKDWTVKHFMAGMEFFNQELRANDRLRQSINTT